MDNNKIYQEAVGESVSAPHTTYDEQLRDWARAIIADRTPVKGGFSPAPLFPVAQHARQVMAPAALDSGSENSTL